MGPLHIQTKWIDFMYVVIGGTHIDLSSLVLLQHQAEHLLIGAGKQTQVKRTLVIRQLTQVH